MKAFLIGLLAWSASAWLATINTLPYLSPAITLSGWIGAFMCIMGLIGATVPKITEKLIEDQNRLSNFPKRKVDIEVPA